MKSLIQYYSVFTFLFAILFSFSCVTTANRAHEKFLHCLSIRSNDSSSISKVVYSPTNQSYSSVLESSAQNLLFTTPTTPKPFVIVTPLHASHIQATIYCSKNYGFQIRTRSGGHDFEGLSYVSDVPFVLIDMVNLKSVDIDVENGVAWVGTGAIIGELYYNIAQKSKTLAFPAGTCHTVGVGGLFSGGGYGTLFRKYGLAADNIIDAQLIDANGRILDRKSMGEDLFWAIRGGGGGSFGIVLAWKLKLVSVPEIVTVFSISRTLEQNATELVHRFQYVAPKLPNDIFTDVALGRLNTTIQATFQGLFLGGVDELISMMKERFPELGLVKQDCTEMSWIQSTVFFSFFRTDLSIEILLNRTASASGGRSFTKIKSDYVQDPIPRIALEGIYQRLYEDEGRYASIRFVTYGGKMAEIPESAVPFPHRAGNLYKIIYFMLRDKDTEISEVEKSINWMRKVHRQMTPYVSKNPRQAYINYRDLDIGANNKKGNTSYSKASIWGFKCFKNNFNKLVHVKTLVDPTNFFKHEQSIPPLSLW